jgi:hypothetical protein
MEAKEKAKELVDKFKSFVDFTNDDFDTCIIATTKNAKQCALIAVDEIMKSNVVWYEDSIPYKYWNEVKQEINNLTN